MNPTRPSTTPNRPEKNRNAAHTRPALPAGPDYWPAPPRRTSYRRPGPGASSAAAREAERAG